MRKGPGSETYPWSFATQLFYSGQPSHGGDHQTYIDGKYHIYMSLRNRKNSKILASTINFQEDQRGIEK